jgi:inner membrane protein
MASLGHVAVGMAAARLAGDRSLRGMTLWSALSLLPDADVIGFSLGVEYGDPWGHRGATHSLAMALLGGLVIFALGRKLRFGLLGAAVLASHGLLDTLTTGGLGVALLWPFSLERFFAPWRPIPVAPIGGAFISMRGLRCAATELVMFSPLWVWALLPRRRRPF